MQANSFPVRYTLNLHTKCRLILAFKGLNILLINSISMSEPNNTLHKINNFGMKFHNTSSTTQFMS
jgi:hypothetical protein